MRYGYEPAETIGALIARVRGEHGITQLKLAERLCASAGLATVTRNEISRWEREERIPSGHWLHWLALVLAVPETELERAVAAARRRRRGADRLAPRWFESAPGVYMRAS